MKNLKIYHLLLVVVVVVGIALAAISQITRINGNRKKYQKDLIYYTDQLKFIESEIDSNEKNIKRSRDFISRLSRRDFGIISQKLKNSGLSDEDRLINSYQERINTCLKRSEILNDSVKFYKDMIEKYENALKKPYIDVVPDPEEPAIF